jgi:excisionase family DNA binding protein
MEQIFNAHNALESQTKSTPKESPIARELKRFRHEDYPLVVRIVDRHLLVTSPDFNFPIPVCVPFDPPTPQQMYKAMLSAWLQIADYLKALDAERKEHPTPKKPKDVIPRPEEWINLGEACRLLGVKADIARDMADSKIVRSKRTPRGHRRFSRMSIEQYVEVENKQA